MPGSVVSRLRCRWDILPLTSVGVDPFNGQLARHRINAELYGVVRFDALVRCSRDTYDSSLSISDGIGVIDIGGRGASSGCCSVRRQSEVCVTESIILTVCPRVLQLQVVRVTDERTCQNSSWNVEGNPIPRTKRDLRTRPDSHTTETVRLQVGQVRTK